MSFDSEQIRRHWRERGFGCHAHTDAPHQEWRDLADPRDELVFILSGELEVEIEGTVYQLRPGDELFIPADARHSSRAGSEPVALLYGYRGENG